MSYWNMAASLVCFLSSHLQKLVIAYRPAHNFFTYKKPEEFLSNLKKHFGDYLASFPHSHRWQLCKVDMKSTCRKLQRQSCATCGACSLSVFISPQQAVTLSAASAALYGNQALSAASAALYGN